jgi:uncharacterized RDD family membrane protein YckC
MSDTGPRRTGVSFEVKPHAYDPLTSPELFEGVLARRMVAFFIDFLIIALPVVFAVLFVTAMGIVTFGLGFIFFALVPPAAVIWALAYYGLCFGSPQSATIGMRAMDLEMRTWYGSPAYFVLGAVHAIVFWITVSALTPFILLIGLLNDRRRLLHDLLLGTVVINNPARSQALRTDVPPVRERL